MKSVSIIIPAYNASSFVAEAIESIIKQDYEDFEIIVVDDGSTDSTRDVLEKFIANQTIKYIFQRNSGPGAARNRGLAEATGDYICFLDADDELVSGSISKRVKVLNNYPRIGMVFTDFYKKQSNSDTSTTIHFNETNFLIKFNKALVSSKKNLYMFGNKFFECALEYNPFVSTITVMLRADVIKKIGLFNTKLKVAEDVDYWLRVCRSEQICFIDEPLSIYNNYRSFLTKNDDRFFADSISFYRSLLDEVKSNNKYSKLLKKKLSTIEFDYAYSLFHEAKYTEANKHFIISFLLNKFNHESIRWILFSKFPIIYFFLRKKVD